MNVQLEMRLVLQDLAQARLATKTQRLPTHQPHQQQPQRHLRLTSELLLQSLLIPLPPLRLRKDRFVTNFGDGNQYDNDNDKEYGYDDDGK